MLVCRGREQGVTPAASSAYGSKGKHSICLCLFLVIEFMCLHVCNVMCSVLHQYVMMW